MWGVGYWGYVRGYSSIIRGEDTAMDTKFEDLADQWSG